MVAVSTQLNVLETKSAAVATLVVAGALLAQAFVLPSVLGLKHYVLAPRIDMLNHRGGTKSEVTYQALQVFCPSSLRHVRLIPLRTKT
jgi:hypothetical protein